MHRAYLFFLFIVHLGMVSCGDCLVVETDVRVLVQGTPSPFAANWQRLSFQTSEVF